MTVFFISDTGKTLFFNRHVLWAPNGGAGAVTDYALATWTWPGFALREPNVSPVQ